MLRSVPDTISTLATDILSTRTRASPCQRHSFIHSFILSREWTDRILWVLWEMFQSSPQSPLTDGLTCRLASEGVRTPTPHLTHKRTAWWPCIELLLEKSSNASSCTPFFIISIDETTNYCPWQVDPKLVPRSSFHPLIHLSAGVSTFRSPSQSVCP